MLERNLPLDPAPIEAIIVAIAQDHLVRLIGTAMEMKNVSIVAWGTDRELDRKVSGLSRCMMSLTTPLTVGQLAHERVAMFL